MGLEKMTLEEILGISKKRGKAFDVLIPISGGSRNLLAHRIGQSKKDPQKVIFWTEKGPEELLPEEVAGIRPLSIQELVKEMCRLEKRAKYAEKNLGIARGESKAANSQLSVAKRTLTVIKDLLT